MTDIVSTIQQSADLTALADAGDWSALAAAWPEQRLPDHRASGRETLVALSAAGIDANAVLTAVEASPVGRRLLGLLDTAGVNWADPVTIQLLDNLVSAGGITQVTADTLTAISLRFETVPTADEIKAAWLRHNITAVWSARQAVVEDGIFDGTITTLDDIVAAIGGV